MRLQFSISVFLGARTDVTKVHHAPSLTGQCTVASRHHLKPRTLTCINYINVNLIEAAHAADESLEIGEPIYEVGNDAVSCHCNDGTTCTWAVLFLSCRFLSQILCRRSSRFDSALGTACAWTVPFSSVRSFLEGGRRLAKLLSGSGRLPWGSRLARNDGSPWGNLLSWNSQSVSKERKLFERPPNLESGKSPSVLMFPWMTDCSLFGSGKTTSLVDCSVVSRLTFKDTSYDLVQPRTSRIPCSLYRCSNRSATALHPHSGCEQVMTWDSR